MVFSIFARGVTLLAGLIVQRYILLAFGSSLNGLTSSITQIMSYLVLLEAGLGSASIQALYHPLQLNDWDEVSSIFSATSKTYRKIAAIFVALLIGVSILIPLAVENQVDYLVAGMLTLITGGSYVASYIFGGKYKALLTADNKIYILYILDSLSTILSCILRVIALQNGSGIIFVQAINLFCVFVKNISYILYVRLKYNNIDYFHSPNYYAIRKRWNVLIHQIAGIIVNHTDILILTIFSDLKLVSLYSVYNMVFGQLSTLIQSTFAQAPQATFGKAFNSGDKIFYKLYKSYETLFTILLFVISTIALVMILPFISIYTKGVTDINYISNILPIMFTCILMMNQIRTPAIITINVSGDFKETQYGAIIEAVINASVSLALYFFTNLGLYGLLIGTIASYAYRSLDVLIYVYKKILHQSIGRYAKNIVINLAIMLIMYFLMCYRWPVHVNSVSQWIVITIENSMIILSIYMVINILLNKEFRIMSSEFAKKCVKL